VHLLSSQRQLSTYPDKLGIDSLLDQDDQYVIGIRDKKRRNIIIELLLMQENLK
jgi:hypothetical protein